MMPSLRTVAMPADANPSGDIFGGWLMAQMDLAGGIYASNLALGRVATVAVDAMTFHKPVFVGDQVSCYCSTKNIGTTSISVLVETKVLRRDSGGLELTVTEGVFTFVAINADGKPRPILDQPTP